MPSRSLQLAALYAVTVQDCMLIKRPSLKCRLYPPVLRLLNNLLFDSRKRVMVDYTVHTRAVDKQARGIYCFKIL